MKECLIYERQDDSVVICRMCNRFCKIKPNKKGACLAYENSNGILNSLTWGKITGAAIDPIEKKPFYNFRPRTYCLSFGTPGCNFFCKNCQNSDLSQGLKNKNLNLNYIKTIEPKILIEQAIKSKVDGIAYTYSEPTIFFEYVRDCILESRKYSESKDFYHILVSNGYLSSDLIKLIDEENLIDAINIDLKFINNNNYKLISKASLEPVLENIELFWKLRNKIHIEITNLIIPSINDSTEDIKLLINSILSISKSIPIHFSRFHPDYLMSDIKSTPIETLIKARNLAIDAGLEYVYLGNTDIIGTEDTVCPYCHTILIKRSRMRIIENNLSKTENNKYKICPKCGETVNIV